MAFVEFSAHFLKNETQAIVALSAFVIFLLAILFRIYWVTRKYLSIQCPEGFDKISTVVKYSTRDGNHLEYEMEKYLLCKKLLATEHEHQFSWTGTKEPELSSDTMTYMKTTEGENGFKKAIFKFKNPIPFNGAVLAQIRMKVDDSDHQSQTQISLHVREKTQKITFNVQLLHKRKAADATIKKRRIDTPLLSFETVCAIPFDAKLLSYNHTFYEPEVGYTYRLEWQR